MEMIKDETTARLDEVTRLADETLTLYEDLIDSVDEEALRGTMAECIQKQRSLLQALFQARRARDELPRAGDDERGHLSALVASASRLIADDDAPVIQKLADANRKLRDTAEAACEHSLPVEERRLVTQLIASCDSLDKLLDAHGGQPAGGGP